MKKRTLKIKRAIACFLTALMLLTMLPVSAFAVDESNGELKTKLGITTEGVTVTQISEENEDKISDAAQDRSWGIYASDEIISNGFMGGRIYSACHINSTESTSQYVTITMDVPTLIEEDETRADGWVVLALVDGELVTYPAKGVGSNQLEFNVRLGEDGTDIALSYLTNMSSQNPVGDWGTLTLEPDDVTYHPSLGYVREYTLTYTVSENIATYLQNAFIHWPFDLTFYLNSTGLKIDAESISFGENDLFELNPDETEKVGDGCYKFTVNVDTKAWKNGSFSNVVGISYAAPNASSLLFEGEMRSFSNLGSIVPNASMMGCVPLPLTVVEAPDDGNTYHKITVTQTEGGKIEPHGVEGEVWVKEGKDQIFTITPDAGYHITDVKVDGNSVGVRETYTFENVTVDSHTITATFEKNPAVTITPANLTVYEGGAGYEGVVDEAGEAIEGNAFPEPLFTIALPEGSEDAPTDLTFTNTTSGNSWKVEKVGTDAEGTTYYRLVDTTGSDDPIRIQFIGDDGSVIESDMVTTTTDVYDTHEIAIFSNKEDVVTATAGDTTYTVAPTRGTLTVRAVQDDDATGAIATTAPTQAPAAEMATAVASTGTTYTIGETGVSVAADAVPSLLFDSIIEDAADSTARTDALKARINTVLGTETNVYDIKYLDLVDANNGNAWIKASEPIDIYWGYPADTDQNTKFTVVHFKDLHRDGAQSGFELADISSCEVELIPAESTPQGIKFSVQPGQFSPFALIAAQDYTITATAGNGGTISPSGAVTVNAGADQTFAITPNSGYSIADVKVDGTSVGDVNSYTFEDVAANHTINATFTYNGGGTITPDPTPDPDPEPTPDPDEPGIADPDDTGVADWLNTEDHEVFLNGYPDGSFGPDRSMTRAEVAAMFSNLLLDKNVPITTSFSDVAEDAWYADAVNMLASLDMIAGYEDGTFRPDAPITRAEFTAIAMRFADAAPEGENIFSDVHAGDWFYDVVVGSIQYGWIGGYEDGTFRPQNTITRAEVTAITNRMLGRVADEAFIDAADVLRSFSDLSDAHWAYYSIMEATNAHDYTTSDGVEEWEALH